MTDDTHRITELSVKQSRIYERLVALVALAEGISDVSLLNDDELGAICAKVDLLIESPDREMISMLPPDVGPLIDRWLELEREIERLSAANGPGRQG